MAIRVLRILEYTYETEEQAAEDMQRWTKSLDLDACWGKLCMKSTTLPFDAIDWETNE